MITFNEKDLRKKCFDKPFGFKKDILKYAKKIPNTDIYSLHPQHFAILKEKYKNRTSLLFKVKSFFKHLVNNLYIYFKTRKVKAPKVLSDSRMRTCLNCPELTEKKTCRVCGCHMPTKSKLIYAECPLKKWI